MSGKVWTSRLFDAQLSLLAFGEALSSLKQEHLSSDSLTAVQCPFMELSASRRYGGFKPCFLRKNQCPTASRSTESSVYMYDHVWFFMLESFFCQGESEGHDEAWRSRLDMQKWLVFFELPDCSAEDPRDRASSAEPSRVPASSVRVNLLVPVWIHTLVSGWIFLRHSPQARSRNCPSIPTALH